MLTCHLLISLGAAGFDTSKIPSPPPKPGAPLINEGDDNEITFDFDKEDEEDLDDFDEDFDDFDDDEGYDDGDYADDAERLPRRKKPAGAGGILGWFKRGR